MRAIVAQTLLRADFRSDEVPELLWRSLSTAVLSALGVPGAVTDRGFEETAVALKAVACLAVYSTAADALLEGGTLEVPASSRRHMPPSTHINSQPVPISQALLLRLLDHESSVPVRRLALAALKKL